MNRQDGPLDVGGQDATTNRIRPLAIDTATGALIVTPASGSGGAVTIADGADVAEGAIADAAATAGGTGTVSAKLRGLSRDLVTVQAPVAPATATATKSVLLGGQFNASPTIRTEGQQGVLQTTNGGALLVEVDLASVVGQLENDTPLTSGSESPVIVGGRASTAAPTAVSADNDTVYAWMDRRGSTFVRHGVQGPVASTWTGAHIPSTNTQATKTQSSAGTGKRNVCTGFTVTLAAGASAPTAAAPISVSVIDGNTGGGTYLWRSIINLPATAGAISAFVRGGLWLVGSQATQMTIEFSAAVGPNTYESVSFEGVVIEE